MRRARLPGILLLFTLLLVFVMSGCAEDQQGGEEKMTGQEAAMEDMSAMETVPDSLRQMKLAPLVPAYYEGGEAFFIHTETSDESVAQMLTKMMGPEVVYVPGLAEVPEALLAPIYVFENGVEGIGPMDYQRDVLTSVPGEEGYSPLRQIHLVSWNEEAEPEELQSAEAIQQAADEGRLSIQQTDRIVNAPVLVWPGGHR